MNTVKDYFRFVAVEDSSILVSCMNMDTGEPDNTIDLQYSKDGKSWTQYNFTAIPLTAGETLYMKGNNPNGFSIMDMENDVGRVVTFADMSGEGNGTTGTYECHGNIMSLMYGDDFENKNIIPSAGCFYSLFMGCVGLLTAPELPATTLAAYCYTSMFGGCTSLINAPELPATTLANSCYYYMFRGCTSLINAPELPATTLAAYCYHYMFQGCTSLVTAPELPATTLTEGCYCYMFGDCTSLVTAPELPATKLASECYSSMFQGCTSLVTAPEILPATTLASDCYNGMFYSCTSLVTAPELPATTLASDCYNGMFYSCTSLVTAPELPATTLTAQCYIGMFSNCTSLVTAPELPATTLANYCYQYMFEGCSKLNNITMLATDISATDCLYQWVSGVTSTGTFTKHTDMTSLPTGNNGIPEGWEVKDNITLTECTSLTITAEDVDSTDTTTTIQYTATCNGVDYKGDTVTGIIVEGTAVSAEFPQNTSETDTVERTITFEFMGVTASTVITQGVWVPIEKQYLTFEAIEDSTFKLTQNACEYSLDNGGTWVSLSANTNTPTVTGGNKLLFKVTNPSISTDSGIGRFSSTGKFNVSGNIMSLLYGDDFIDKTDLNGKNYVFKGLFSGCTNVVEAHNLALPATTLASYCYDSMFNGCHSLVTAPELPATTLTEGCYYYMFNGCTSLNNITMLATDISAGACLESWVNGVASTGTFTKHQDMTALPTGGDGIPSGWTIVDYAA